MTGELIKRGPEVWESLPPGNDGEVLSIVNGEPAWAELSIAGLPTPGNAGTVLTSLGPTEVPVWQEPGSTGIEPGNNNDVFVTYNSGTQWDSLGTMLDRVFGTTVGSVIQRGSSGWAATNINTLLSPWFSGNNRWTNISSNPDLGGRLQADGGITASVWGANTNGAYFTALKSRGAVDTPPLPAEAGDLIGHYNYQAYDTAGVRQSLAGIVCHVAERNVDVYKTNLHFRTSGVDGFYTTRAQLNSTGNLGVSVTPNTAAKVHAGPSFFVPEATMYGYLFDGTWPVATYTSIYGVRSTLTLQAGVTTTHLINFSANTGVNTAAVTNLIGFEASATLTGGINNYGFKSSLAAATNTWGFYGGTANNYLNGDTNVSTTGHFGFGTVYGDSGYGFRSNAGVVEVKNSGGTWGPIGNSMAPWNVASETGAAGVLNNAGLFHHGASRFNCSGTATFASFADNSSGPYVVLMKSRSPTVGTWISATVSDCLGNLSFSTGIGGGPGVGITPVTMSSIASYVVSVDGDGVASTGDLRFRTSGLDGNNVTRATLGYQGNLGLGIGAADGMKLRIRPTTCVATASTYGCVVDGDFPQFAYTTVYGYRSTATIPAGSSATSIIQYSAALSSTGVNSSPVTNLIGFEAASSLSYGINNYGFKSNLNAATNTWGFYGGTANNFLNGDSNIRAGGYLGFGTTYGSSGYGFRDNAGTIEYKNSTGAWTAIPAGGTTVPSPPSSYQVMSSSGTNFQWRTMSDMFDYLFTSAVGSMLVRGSSGWNYLNPGSSGTVLKSTGSSTTPAWSTLPSIFDTVFGTTSGSVIYRDSSTWYTATPPASKYGQILGYFSGNFGYNNILKIFSEAAWSANTGYGNRGIAAVDVGGGNTYFIDVGLWGGQTGVVCVTAAFTGTSPLANVVSGTAGQILISNGSSAMPSWGAAGQPVPAGTPSTWPVGMTAYMKNTAATAVGSNVAVAGSTLSALAGADTTGFLIVGATAPAGTWTNRSGNTINQNYGGLFVRTV